MSTQIPFPNKRLAQAGIGNPLFVTDIENATEDLLEALAVLYGFASNGFAILSGFDYGAGAYTGGIVYMNGVFYRCVAGLTENQYLTPDVQDVDNKIFSDANTYPTYRIYQAVAAGAQWGGMPQFVGNMNSYRVSIKKVYDLAVQVVNSTETVRGIVELATSAEVIAGTDTERAVTPAGLEAKTATDARKGIVELATNAETQTGTDAERAITPAALSARTATDTRTGLIEIATNAEVQAGTDAERAVTPAGLEAKTATDARKGIVELATNAETQTGTDAERAVTPAALSAKDASLITRIIEIGVWNMDTTNHVTVSNPYSIGNIREFKVLIQSDSTEKVPLDYLDISFGDERTSGSYYLSSSGFELWRSPGGHFDSTEYNASINRGWIIIRHLS